MPSFAGRGGSAPEIMGYSSPSSSAAIASAAES